MIDYKYIIDKYYPEANQLRDILLIHSSLVANYAVAIVDKHPELGADRDFVYAAAMLHDIGISRCDADGIQCFGTEPYICHGIIGGQMLRESKKEWGIPTELVEKLARVCERHTGTGLTRKQIEERNLPLPHIDLVPETIEEQIICYADKFFSKTHPERQKTFEKACHSLEKFGQEGVLKFQHWHDIFE